MKVKVVSKKYNPLLKRKEVIFEVEHEKLRGTPPRLEIRTKLAEMLKMKLEQIYVRKVDTKTGTMIALGEANAYDTVEQAILTEPKYVIERNTPKEKEKAKEAEKPKKAEKPEKAEKPAKKAEEAEKAEKAEKAKQPKETRE